MMSVKQIVQHDPEVALRKELALERSRGAIRQTVADLERELGTVPAFPATMHLCAALDGIDKIARRLPK